jgi:hypothetical protein
MTTTWLLTGRFRANRDLAVVAGAPMATFQLGSESETTIGNPYLGLEFGRANDGFSGEVGAHAPLASEESDVTASLSGVFSDVDRWESFWPALIPIVATANYRRVYPSGVLLRGRLGPSLWIPEHDGDVEMFALYGLWTGYEGPNVRVAGGWSGRVLITDQGVFGEDNLYHQLSLIGDFGPWQVRPGVSVRIPLNNDLDNIVGPSFGIHVNARL